MYLRERIFMLCKEGISSNRDEILWSVCIFFVSILSLNFFLFILFIQKSFLLRSISIFLFQFAAQCSK